MMYFPYIIVFLVAALVGFSELVARYRDAPLDAVRRLPAFSYVAINGAAGAIALCVIRAFDWTFGAETDSTIQIMQVAVAGFAAMAFLRSSLFTVRVGDADVHAGPSALIKILLDVADRAVDRGRAQRRSDAVQKIMANLDFEKAKQTLPSDCLALMTNVAAAERQSVMKDVASLVASLESSPSLSAMPKARQLGLVLIDVVGEDVLRTSVEALGDEITVSDNT